MEGRPGTVGCGGKEPGTPYTPFPLLLSGQVEDLKRVKVLSGKQLESFLKVSSRLGPSPGLCPALPLTPLSPCLVAGEHPGFRRGEPVLRSLLTTGSALHFFFFFKSLYNRF